MDRGRAEAAFTDPAREALAAFGLAGAKLSLVNVSENVTFRVHEPRSDQTYVLRLHRPGYHDLAELEAERVWARALARDGMAVPAGVATPDGRDFVSVAVPQTGEHRHAGLLHWVQGEVLGEVLLREDDERVTEHYFGQLGGVVGALHNQSSAWTPPARFRRPRLDVAGLIGEAPFWGRFWEHPSLSAAERRLIFETRDRIRAALTRYGEHSSTFGLIHADLHPFNVLVQGDRLTVIDFDDAAFGWHMYDVAVALVHQQGQPNFAAIQARFIEGYRAHRPLADHDLAQASMFSLIRGLVQLGWVMDRPELDPPKQFDAIKAALCARCAAFHPQ